MTHKPKGEWKNGRYVIFRPSKKQLEAAKDFNAPIERQDDGKAVGVQKGIHETGIGTTLYGKE